MPAQVISLSCMPCCTGGCTFGIGCTLLGVNVLHVTLEDFNGCACLDGAVFPIFWDPINLRYIGSISICNDSGCAIQVIIDCFSSAAEADCLDCNTGAQAGLVCVGDIAQLDLGSATCVPLHLRYLFTFQDRPNNPCGQGHMCCISPNAQFHGTITL